MNVCMYVCKDWLIDLHYCNWAANERLPVFQIRIPEEAGDTVDFSKLNC